MGTAQRNAMLFPGGDYWQRVVRTAPANLISYWPLWDASGTSVVNLASLRGMPAAVGYGVVNLCSNPSFETGTTGWAPFSGSTLTRTTAQHQFGSASCLVKSGGGQNYAQATYANVPVTNQAHMVSGYVLNDNVPVGGNVAMYVYWMGGDQPDKMIGGAVCTVAETIGGWRRINRLFVPDQPDRTSANFYVLYEGCTANGQGFYLEGFQIEESATPTPYCDGDQPGCRWTGTAHASTSERIGPIPNAVSSNVTLAQPGIGDGKPAMLFNGTSSYVNIYSTQLADAFNGAEGTLLVWAKVKDAGVWTDGTERRAITLEADSGNYIMLKKDAFDNLVMEYKAGGVGVFNWEDVDSLEWMCLALTYSAVADEARTYVNGEQLGNTLNSLGAWVGAIAASWTTIGAQNINPFACWSGTIAHVALWNTPLSAAQIAYLSRVR